MLNETLNIELKVRILFTSVFLWLCDMLNGNKLIYFTGTSSGGVEVKQEPKPDDDTEVKQEKSDEEMEEDDEYVSSFPLIYVCSSCGKTFFIVQFGDQLIFLKYMAVLFGKGNSNVGILLCFQSDKNNIVHK